MPDFEYISRPFAPLPVRPAGKTFKHEPIAPGSTVFSWGSGGDDAFQLRASNQNQVDNGNDHIEISRKFDVVKVKDPNNDENFIQTEVMKEYQARNRVDDSRIKIRFKETEGGGNVEILQRNQTRTNPAGNE